MILAPRPMKLPPPCSDAPAFLVEGERILDRRWSLREALHRRPFHRFFHHSGALRNRGLLLLIEGFLEVRFLLLGGFKPAIDRRRILHVQLVDVGL